MAARNRQLRSKMKQARNNLSSTEHREGSASIRYQLLKSGLVATARRVAIFWPTDGEPDMLPLLGRWSEQGRNCFLPRLLPFTSWPKQHRLGFVGTDGPLQQNRYGIPEPVGRPVALQSLDLVLVPLLVFNSRRQRVGRGKGYYDRTLAPLQRHFCWSRPKLIGVAFAFQQSEEILLASHDVPMDLIVTDKGVI